jgi:hypothetical protein
MKNSLISLSIIALMTINLVPASEQNKSTGVNTINASDLESYLSFIASPLLKGRKNGEEGLQIVATYIASQAKKIGLKPGNNNSYFQQYQVVSKSFDPDKTSITIIPGTEDPVIIREPIYQLMPMGAADLEIEGDVLFAGYGINAAKFKYNDLDSLDLTGKIILIMSRAPMTADGRKTLFEDQRWLSFTGLQMKIQFLMFSKAKAILIVQDPKSGFTSFEESNPDLASYMNTGLSLKNQKNQIPDLPGMPRVIFVHRKVANEILNGTGYNLTDLQQEIDNKYKPHSFQIKGKRIKITEVSITKEKNLPNVVAFTEGSDPVLKNEFVIFSGHMDHLGMNGDKIYPGADDDASGCAALLEMAEAFVKLPKKPLRSIVFLWVSGEEIGLFGSQSYVDNPPFPLDKTVADLNMDMIGRVKTDADTSKNNPMTGPGSVFVITDSQSKELTSIAERVAKKTGLTLDYSLSGRSHPLQLFARSDHYNFVRKNIPVLFFTSGLHATYHTSGDVIEKIEFNKLELVTKTMFQIGYEIANKKTRIVVDNPFSTSNSSAATPNK